MAHQSVEGGGKTIGPGLKINSTTHPLYKAVNQNKAIKTDILNELLDLELRRHKALTKEYIYKNYDKQSWDTLSTNIKQLLIRKSFNTKNGGIANFPKLINAAVNGDISMIKKESESTYTKGGRVKPLKRENEMIKELIYYQ